MNFKMHASGNAVIASLLAGGGSPVDGLLVELDTVSSADFSGRAEDAGKHAIVRARGRADGADVEFTGLVRGGDFGKHRKGAKITRVTALCGAAPVATSLVSPPVPVSDEAYITVSISMKIGD